VGWAHGLALQIAQVWLDTIERYKVIY